MGFNSGTAFKESLLVAEEFAILIAAIECLTGGCFL
eukprot:CAMPEP_0195252812 /NCGR_PEP_ID=MMETSP0706-20130129/4082_1 /TAXON_ID=33640 /ORGANISM="Asterionellopsis glacialis, Strain CCMP134" /LENGTH=35 /DNA_ID= /DNA_START= /DNA_END= /DNA_ORIENTATION=